MIIAALKVAPLPIIARKSLIGLTRNRVYLLMHRIARLNTRQAIRYFFASFFACSRSAFFAFRSIVLSVLMVSSSCA